MSQKWIQCWKSSPFRGKADLTAFFRAGQGSGPSEREAFYCGLVSAETISVDLRCQAGKLGRLPLVRHHWKSSVALEVVKTVWFFCLGSALNLNTEILNSLGIPEPLKIHPGLPHSGVCRPSWRKCEAHTAPELVPQRNSKYIKSKAMGEEGAPCLF